MQYDGYLAADLYSHGGSEAMTETAIQIRTDGSAEIYWSGQQYLRVSDNGGEPRWLKRTSRGLRPVRTHRARRLERIYRHPETAEPFKRYPRLESPLELGQPVYSSTFGFGEIVAIDGNNITVTFGEEKRLVETQGLVTRVRAEVDWHNYWLNGEKRRLREGKRLSIVKGLCRFGEWQAFLDRYDYPRSTADDLIGRWAETQQLTGNRAIGDPDPDQHPSEQIPDPDADGLEKLVREETEKRRGRTPSHHREYWSVRIQLPPSIVTRCRERYKQPGAKKYWQHAAYKFAEKESTSDA